MKTTERNWLIRTSQNQILGPVVKTKVVEFLNKGALGLNDEVSSGNGYWFHLRERDLVEKYLLGDVPQSFNPIAEALSVYSRKENPEKTTSINASPANRNQLQNAVAENNISIPSEEDLDFPDITLVGNLPKDFKNKSNDPTPLPEEEIKVPAGEDLEYPDITAIVSNSYLSKTESVQQSIGSSQPTEQSTNQNASVEEAVVYPKNDDLEFPDLDSLHASASIATPSPKKVQEPTSENIIFEVDLEAHYNEKNISEPPKNELKKAEVTDSKIRANSNQGSAKSDKPEVASIPKEERKILTDRKVKNSKKEEAKMTLSAGRPLNTKPLNNMPREIAPELKKRNDSYLFIILIVLVIFILAVFFYYYRFILNKPLPV